MVITIDGPAASGKSTIAHALAILLNYYYLNSGMLYRALGYCLVRSNIAYEQIADYPIQTDPGCLNALNYSYDMSKGIMKIKLDGQDITQELKTPLIDKAASYAGRNKAIRAFLKEYQQNIGENNPNLIAEGRDAGSIVFPHAQLKFFLTARPEVRAQRWLDVYMSKNNDPLTFEQALQLIKERDNRDKNGIHAPLRPEIDSILIDNSDMAFDQTVAMMVQIIKEYRERR